MKSIEYKKYLYPVGIVLVVVIVTFLKLRSTVAIGYFGPFSGQESNKGTQIQKGLQIAVDDWNKKAGFFGVKLELKSVDTLGMNQEVENNIAQLVEKDKVSILVGESQDKRTEIAMAYAEKKQIPLLVPYQQNLIVNKSNSTVTVLSPSLYEYGITLADFITKGLKLDHAHVLKKQNFKAADSIDKIFVERFKMNGGKIYNQSTFTVDDLSQDSYYQHLISANPPLIVVMSSQQETAAISKVLRGKGYKGQIVGLSLWDNVDVRAIAGEGILGTYFVGTFSPSAKKESIQRFVKQYDGIHHQAPSAYAAMGYDTGLLIQEMMKSFHLQYSSMILKNEIDKIKSERRSVDFLTSISVFRVDKDEDTIVYPK